MFKTKQQVDHHVRTIQAHLKSDKERNLRGLNFSQLYYKVGEYELSRRYISNYMSVNDKSPVAFKQLGLCLDALGQKEKAFAAYKTSLELEPKQPELLIKVCEILLQGDVILDPNRTKYWCELAEHQFPSNNTVFRLKEKILEAQDSNPTEIKELILKEISANPADPFLRIRFLQHLMQQNLIIDAFQHAQEIELKNLSMFNDNMKWYDTLSDILQKYSVDMDQSKKSTWDYWLFNITVLEKQVCLSLSETHNCHKSLVDCANALFNLDQALNEVFKLKLSLCKERELSSQFILHFEGQLCLHLATFLLKRAKKDHNIWKEIIKHCAPLLLLAFHSSPPDLHDNWLNHTTEVNRQIIQKWNREGSYRCSQAGHTVLSCITEKKKIFLDRISNYCSGMWRQKLYKVIFSKLDHISKMESSYFVKSATFQEPTLTLPGSTELKIYDEVAQRQYPGSLHHLVWLGLPSKTLWDLKCNIFEGLQFSVNNLANCNAECLNKLDMDTFLYSSVLCAQALCEESSNSGYVSTEKPTLLPANIMEQLCTAQQSKWWATAYKLYKNETQTELGELRLTITRGIEIVRCVGQHGLDAKLLCMLANIFKERAKVCEIKSEKHFLEARVSLFYTTAYPLLQRLKSHQTICPTTNRMFNFIQKDIKMSEILHMIEELKMFQGTQLMNDGDHEKALEIFHTIKNPYASFYQGVIYKKLAANQVNSSKENLTSEMRSKHIIMLSKSRECFHLTLDRLREKIGEHPLDEILASHIEEVEEQLSRIDPDTCVNRNDCELLSEDNISSAGSLGEHIQLNLSSNYVNNSYNHVNLNSTPKHKSRNNTTQNLRSCMASNYEVRRTESRPSPERLDAQIRSLSLKREHDMTSLMDTIQLLVDEIKDMKSKASQESKAQKGLIEELKTEVADLKKYLGKNKSAPTPNLDDQDFGYLLEEELQNQEYSLPNLYPNYQHRVPQNANIGYPNHLYQNPVYPMYPYSPMQGAVPFVEGQQMQEYRNQLLNQQLIYNQTMLNKLNPQDSVSMLQAMNTVYPQSRPSDVNLMANRHSDLDLSNQQSSNQVQNQSQCQVSQVNSLIGPSFIASQAGGNGNNLAQTPIAVSKTQTIKPAPVNVVITSSDPLPSHTTSSFQPTLSVTIPAHHIKTSAPQTVQNKGIHNYQIAMPNTASTPIAQNTFTNKLPPQTKSLVFGSSSAMENIFSSPKTQSATNLVNETPLLSIGNSEGFQTPNNISTKSNASVYGTPGSNSMNQSEAVLSTPGTVISNRLNRSSDSQCSNISISERYDPLPDFKPIIPLPDVVEIKTGEEDEEVIFKSRAKLYRFVNKEWKERGVGELKLLKNKITKKVRVLMRRDHTHKICANHIITSDMNLTLSKNETKAYVWFAPDFADENVIHEKLCARFKTEELAKSFHDAFEKSRKECSSSVESNAKDKDVTTTNVAKGFGDKFKLKDGSWSCSACYTVNTAQQDNCGSCATPNVNPTTEKLSVGGFTFSGTPAFSPKGTDNKTVAPAETSTTNQKPSPFTGFSFSMPNSQSASSSVNPFAPLKPSNKEKSKLEVGANKLATVGKPIMDSKITSNKNESNSESTIANTSSEDVDEFIPTAEFTPVIPLPEVVSEQTGEENENILFEERAKLLRFHSDTKEWKERGLGIMKILVAKNDNQKVRLLMRREIVLKVCCNHFITKEIQFNRMPSEKMNSLTWSAQDYAENEVKTEVFAIRFKTKELCDKFHNTILDAQMKMNKKVASKPIEEKPAVNSSGSEKQNIKAAEQLQGFGDKFKPKSGSWACKACYINNDGDKVYCIACDNPKDDTIPKKDKNIFGGAQELPKFTFGMPVGDAQVQTNVVTSSGLSFGANPTQNKTEFTFGIPKNNTTTNFGSSNSPFKFSSSSTPTAGFSFGATNVTPVGNASKDNSEVKTDIPFASGGTGKFEFVFAPKSPKTKSPLKNSSRTENESDGDEEYASDGEGDNIYFTPVIPLPEKVAVTTGEENEEVLYCHRAKLFRFAGHEWKERGLGDIKILKHSETKKIRVLMRRSQILKICLNHILTPDIEYLPKDEKTWLFTANDFSDEEFALQQFCVRFKTEDIAKEFKKAIDSAQKTLCKSNIKSGNKLTELVSDDSDVEVTYETKVTEEEKKMARKYMLPDNFYAYKYKEDCEGCIGCKSDEFQFSSETSQNNVLNTSTASTSFSFLKTQAELKPAFTNEQNATFGGSFFGQLSFGDQSKNSDEKTSSPSIFGRTIFGQQTTKTEIVKTDSNTSGILKPPLFSAQKDEPLKPVFGGNIFSLGGIASKPTEQNKSEVQIDKHYESAKPVYKFGQNIFNVNPVNLEKSSVPVSNSFDSTSSDKKVDDNVFGAPNISIKPLSTVKGFGDTAASQPTFPLNSSIVPSLPQAEIKEDTPMFKTDSSLSFANIASAKSNTFGQGLGSGDKTAFSWAGAGAPVFGSKQTPQKKSLNASSNSDQNTSSINLNQDEEENNEESEAHDDEYDPHYDPIIDMPEAIVVTTGEEDETKLFCERAKLFRYDSTTKEWKERGVGEMKLLYHPDRNSYRLLLRREQVHKLVLNQLLDRGFILNPMNLSDRAWCWAGINHAEQPGKGEELAVRFKNSELAAQFKNVVDSAIQKISETSTSYVTQTYSDDDEDDGHENDEVEDDDDNPDYQEEYEDEDDERSVMFDKRATLMTRSVLGAFTNLSMGDLQIVYDSDLFGARIMMFDDNGSCISNTIIAVNTMMSVTESDCTWSGIDYAMNEPQIRTLRAHFSSSEAAVEFYNTYKEGVSFAREADIMDPIPDVFTPEDD